MNRWRLAAIAGCTAFLGFRVFAQEEASIDTASRAYQVAVFFKQKPEGVQNLRRQGYGYGEIVKILVIAREAHKGLRELLQLNQEGLGWGTIARQSGLSAVRVKAEVDRIRTFLDIQVQPADTHSVIGSSSSSRGFQPSSSFALR
jgi:hypothetical protein